MKYRSLGKTGVQVSELGIGTWQLGGSFPLAGSWSGYAPIEEDEAIAILRQAYNLGVNFIDTSDIYGLGRAERLIARAFQGNREKVFICTKVGGIPDGVTGWESDISPSHLQSALFRSFKRLNTDYIDFYLIQAVFLPSQYWESLEEAVQTLLSFRSRGWIRFWGVSLEKPEEGIEIVNRHPVDVLQVRFNLFSQEPAAEFFPLAKKAGVGIIARSPFLYGLLTGKYHAKSRFPREDWRNVWSKEILAKVHRSLKALKPLLEKDMKSYVEVALRFCLSSDAVSTVVFGASSVSQVMQNCSFSDGQYFSSTLLQRLREFKFPV